MSAADRLRAKVVAATPGPWTLSIEQGDEWYFPGSEAVVRAGEGEDFEQESVAVMGCDEDSPNMRLIALAPELAVLLADMADQLARPSGRGADLLARLDALIPAALSGEAAGREEEA